MAQLYVPLDVNAYEDSRLIRVGSAGELLWYRALQLAKRLETDGVLERAQLLRISPRGNHTIDSLVAVGLLRPVDGETCFELAGWLSRNPSVADIEAKRAADRDRKVRGGKANGTPVSGRNPDGIRTESERNPAGVAADSGTRREREREREREVKNNPLPPSQNLTRNRAERVEGKPRPGDVQTVFIHWQTVMGTPNSKLDAKRSARIRWALGNYNLGECLAAIDGCARTPHNMGDNDRGTKYNDVTLIFSDAGHVERFRDTHRTPTPATQPSRYASMADDLDRRIRAGGGFADPHPPARKGRRSDAIDVTGQLDQLTKELGA